MCVGRDTKLARYTSIGAELNKSLQLIATIITYHYVTLVASSLFLAVKMESPPIGGIASIKKPRYWRLYLFE